MDIDRSTGDIYVADTSNCRIQKFDEDGNFISDLGLRSEGRRKRIPGLRSAGNLPGRRVWECSGTDAGPDVGGRRQFRRPERWRRIRGRFGHTVLRPGPAREVILKYSEDGDYLGMINGEASPTGPSMNSAGAERSLLTTLATSGCWKPTAIMRIHRAGPEILQSGQQCVCRRVGVESGDLSVWVSRNRLDVGANVAPDGSYVYLPELKSLYRFVSNGSAYREVMPLYDGWGYYADMVIDPQTGHLIVSRETAFRST